MVAIGGQITVSGAVEKSVVAIGGSVVLTKTAVVKGNVVSLGGVIVMARDAEVDGDLTEINSTNLYETLTTALSSEWEGWSWIFAVISLSIFLGHPGPGAADRRPAAEAGPHRLGGDPAKTPSR